MLEIGDASLDESFLRHHARDAWIVTVNEMLSLAFDVKDPKVFKLVVCVVVVGAVDVTNLFRQYPICCGGYIPMLDYTNDGNAEFPSSAPGYDTSTLRVSPSRIV